MVSSSLRTSTFLLLKSWNWQNTVKAQRKHKETRHFNRKVASLRTRPVYLLFSFLFPELDALLLSPAPHLFRIQCFVLVEVHPVVVFGRTGWRLCWQRQSKQCSQVNTGKQWLTEKLPKKSLDPGRDGQLQSTRAGFKLDSTLQGDNTSPGVPLPLVKAVSAW